MARMAAPPGSDVSGFKRVREARESSAAAAVAKEPPTLRSDLARILLDKATHEKLCDVRLKSAIDGEEVPAVRAILGARSAPLLVLLCGDFAEGTAAVVKMQLGGPTLRALVTYCYTDEFKIAYKLGELLPYAAICIELLAAANLYELKALSSMVREEVTCVLKNNRAMAGKYLQALVSTPNAIQTLDGRALLECLQRCIHLDMVGCLMACEETGVSCLGLEALELVLSDERLKASMTERFRILERWANHGTNHEALWDASKDVRRHIELSLLRPSFLKDVVALTFLFEPAQLAAAFAKIALAAEEKFGDLAIHVSQ
jgi:hypothetical protein